MLCCHGNNRWTQRIIIVAFLIAGVGLSIYGETLNNGSQPEILLAPEMGVAVSGTQSKSPLDPQDMHDHPPQIYVTNPGTVGTKNPDPAALPIPQVETSLPDRDKPNSAEEIQAREQTTQADKVVEISHNEPGIQRPSTVEPEDISSGFLQTVENPSQAENVAQDIEYASGDDNFGVTWESTRTATASERPANVSQSDSTSDSTHRNSTSERIYGPPEEFAQTEVVYDFFSATDLPTKATTETLANTNSTSFEGLRTASDIKSEYPAASITTPWEERHFISTSTIGQNYNTPLNISSDSLLHPETELSFAIESTQAQNFSIVTRPSVFTQNSSSSTYTHYGVSQMGDEVRLLQNHTVPSMEILSGSVGIAQDNSTISTMLIMTNTSIPEGTPTLMIATYIMDSRGSLQLPRSDVLYNHSRATETADALNSSFSIAEASIQTMNATNRSPANTSSAYHFTLLNNFNTNLSNANYTLGDGHFSHVEMIAKNSVLPENVVSEISPTKPSTLKNEENGKHGRAETDTQQEPKRETDFKKESDRNKTQNATNNQTIQKDATGDGQKTASTILTTTHVVQSQWPTSVLEVASSIGEISSTDLSSSTELVLDLYSSAVLQTNRTANWIHENATILLSTIQPSPMLRPQPSETVDTNCRDQPTTAPAGQPDHILPTVKIPTTYLSMTMRCSWSYFCFHQGDLQSIFARYLSDTTKFTVLPTQVVFFNTNVCRHVSYSENEVNDSFANSIVVQMYVSNRHGDYSSRLTERLGHVLIKNKLQGFNDKIKLQDVVLAVQLLRNKEEKAQKAVAHSPKDGDSDMGIIAAITISGIASICLVLLCILLVVLKRRQILKQQSRRCRPVRPDAYSLDSISIYSSFHKRKMRASKRSYLNQGFEDPNAPTNKLNFAGLANLSTDENALAEEYKQIPMAMAKLGDLPPGADLKNRYANVIPFPETRVQLPTKEGDLTLGYINANYVRGFRGDQRTYIATQGPLESTVADFWEMIWENQCKVIIMLTDWEEEGVAKCFPYFSESSTMDSHRRFRDFQVTTKKIDTRESFTISSLQLKNLEKNLMRDVLHYWYTAWPAVGVPSDRVSIVEMLAEARGAMRTASAPTVVHCSPGTGRTGTVLAIHTCTQEYETSRTIDIPQSVYRLRRDRGGCVQTSEQYKFIYDVLHEFASQLRHPSGRSSIRNSK